MATHVTGRSRPRSDRRRNPRGQGSRLRDEIVAAAAELLTETGDPRQLTLRGVAKRIGISPTSIYPHFSDVEHLALAVAEERFAELLTRQRAVEQDNGDPGVALLARCRAYCRFALENPAHYRIMFLEDLGPTLSFAFDDAPGRASFEALVAAIRRCQDAGLVATTRDTREMATLVWAAEHGLASLQITRRRFPWPDIEALVDEAVRRLVGLVRQASPS